MSEPSRITRPDVFALGTSSCIRLRHRMNVDFPHPEGPIIAVTECSRASILSFFKTWLFPYHAFKSSVRTLLFSKVLEAEQPPRYLGIVSFPFALASRS